MKMSRLLFDEKGNKNLEREQFALDVLQGLSSHPKKMSSKYFYDERGSQIFQQITQMDEYYPTRSELEILKNMKDILPQIIGAAQIDIVELGVGDGHKTKILIEGLIEKKIKVQFFPIDISEEALHLLQDNIQENEDLVIHGVVAEYIEGLRFARNNSLNKQLVLFLGSNIGNFSREERVSLLREIKEIMHEKDFLLIGLDLKKDIEVMTRAYSDHEGITAQFNLNLLKRINNELGGDFHPENFGHQALYNPELGAMESYLISLVDQNVPITTLERSFHFDEFEPIHMEYSFKFLEKEINQLGLDGGFKPISNFKDSGQLFIDALWEVEK